MHCPCKRPASLAISVAATSLSGVWARKLEIAGLLALASLAAGGCGSSGETKQDFAARANAICGGALRQTRSIPPPQSGDLASYLDQLLPIVRSEASQLAALRPPKESGAELGSLKRFDLAVKQVASEYAQLDAAARRGDDDGVASAEAALRASPIRSLAASSGLSSCASAGSTTP